MAKHGQGIDTISSACYTIPWKPKKARKVAAASHPTSLADSPFPILREYEQDDLPSRLRYSAFLDATRTTRCLFEHCVQQIYDPLFRDLEAFLSSHDLAPSLEHQQDGNEAELIPQPQLFIPGFQQAQLYHDASTNSLSSIPTAFLISSSAPWLSCFSSRLVSHISTPSGNHQPSIVVTLAQGECPNLTTALRLFVARSIVQAMALYSTTRQVSLEEDDDQIRQIQAAAQSGKCEPDLSILDLWWSRRFAAPTSSNHHTSTPRLVLNIPALETVVPTVLSDLLLALHAFNISPQIGKVQTKPKCILLLGITSPSGALAASGHNAAIATSAPAPWIEFIPRKALQNLDISRFALPSKESVWTRLVQSFLVSPKLPVSLGPKTFEYIRQTFWERDANLDSVYEAVRLAWFLHFSSKPETAFVSLPSDPSLQIHPNSWTPRMLAKLRLNMVGFFYTQETTDPESERVPFPLVTEATLAADSQPNDSKQILKQFMTSDDYLLEITQKLSASKNVLSSRVATMIKFLAQGLQSIHKIESAASLPRNTSQHQDFAAAEAEQQRQIEKINETLTQVVAQCLNASVGSLNFQLPVAAPLRLSSGLARLSNAARRLLSDEFEKLLDDLVLFAEGESEVFETELEAMGLDLLDQPSQLPKTSSGMVVNDLQVLLRGLRSFQQRLAHTITEGLSGVNASDDEDQLGSTRQQEARLARVQKKLEVEERLLGLKREITDWIVNRVTLLVDWTRMGNPQGQGPIHLLANMFWFDSYDSLATLLDPSPRMSLFLPLMHPTEFLGALREAVVTVVPEAELSDIPETRDLAASEMPDICHIYQLYRECGKFVNLADWFEAFRHSIEQDSNGLLKLPKFSDHLDRLGSGKKRKHNTSGFDSRRLKKNQHRMDSRLPILSEEEEEEEEEEDNSSNNNDQDDDDDDDDDDDEEEEDNELVRASLTPKKKSTSEVNRNKQQVGNSEEEEDSDPSCTESDILDTPSRRKGKRVELRYPSSTSKSATTLNSKQTTSQVQARFALAINELARMGLLRATRRKHEHVAKVIWDLVPE